MKFRFIAGLAAILVMTVNTVAAEVNKPDLASAANGIAQKYLLVDTHVDVPYRLEEEWSDVTEKTEDGDFDYRKGTQGWIEHPVHVDLHAGGIGGRG